jgi:hypothetical protein
MAYRVMKHATEPQEEPSPAQASSKGDPKTKKGRAKRAPSRDPPSNARRPGAARPIAGHAIGHAEIASFASCACRVSISVDVQSSTPAISAVNV